jgi:hypothetical protein
MVRPEVSSAKEFEFTVAPTERIGAVMARLPDMEGRWPKRGDVVLGTERTIEDYAIEVDSTVCMVSGMRLFVKLTSVKRPPVAADPTDRIEDVKAKIQDACVILPDEQRLNFAGSSWWDGGTLDDYSIGRDATLHLVLRLRGRKERSFCTCLYPREYTHMTVKLEFTCGCGTLFPAFTGATAQSWTVDATPSGEIANDGKHVPYLFWEGLIDLNPDLGEMGSSLPGRRRPRSWSRALNLSD